jgi:uncharacterized membrane protein
MPEFIVEGLATLTRSLELIAGGLLVLGFILATGRWFMETRREGLDVGVERYRHSLGRVVAIGLEVLVAATIIKTITTEISVDFMIILTLVVGIRTMLAWATALEMSGRWPWQAPRPKAAEPKTT